MARVKKVILYAVGAIAVLYVSLVIVRMFHFYNLNKTNEQVEKIHATKLTLDDVMGKNLPPDPGAEADKTIAGIDANKNGIRDDVELAIFREYPNSAKTRAVLLQYALALQMEVTQPIVNTETVIAVAQDEGRAYYCVGEITSREDTDKFIEIGDRLHGLVENLQLNTEERKKAQHDFYAGNLGSYAALRESCDVDVAALPD